MSIATYLQLKDAVTKNGTSWFKRGDAVDHFDTFLALMEEELYKGGVKSNGMRVDGLRVREMETRQTATLSTSSRFLELPDGNEREFLEARKGKLSYTDSDDNKTIYQIKYLPPSELIEATSPSRPRYFTVTSQYEFESIPDLAYTIEVQCYAKALPLDKEVNTSNDILTTYPSIYLYGCLYHAFQWAMNIQMAAYYKDLFLDAIDGATKEDRWARMGPSPAMIYHGSTP